MAPKKSSTRLQGFREERTLRSHRSEDKTIRLREGLDGDKPKRCRPNPPQRAAAAAAQQVNDPPPPVVQPDAVVDEPAANPPPVQDPVEEVQEDGAGAEGEAAQVVGQQEGGQEQNTGRTITIEYCKQCKAEALQVKTGLENCIPRLIVVLQLEEANSAKKNCFEIREESRNATFRSYVGMNRACKAVKDLAMDGLIADLITEIGAAPQ